MSRRETVTVASLHPMPPIRVPGEPVQQQPRSGDLIISRQPPPHDGFGVSQVPGAVQLSVSRRDAATELARGFAQHHGVDVWEKCGDTYSLVNSCRRTRKAVRAGHAR